MAKPQRDRRRAGRTHVASVPLRRVLVAVDFSRDSSRAITRALSLSLKNDSVLHLLHVLPRMLPPPLDREAESYAHERMTRAVALRRSRLRSATRPEISVSVIRGDSPRDISRFAARMKAGLIVLGRGGLRTRGDRGLGATTRSVVRQGIIPVLVVGGRAGLRYRRPLMALALEENSERALRLAARLADSAHTIRVVHACNVPYQSLLRRTADAADTARHQRISLAEARKEVAAYLRGLGELPAALRVVVRCGAARNVILDAARSSRADLIALGAHRGLSGIQRLFLGSVADDILRSARCDVLIARPGRG